MYGMLGSGKTKMKAVESRLCRKAVSNLQSQTEPGKMF